MYNTLGFILKKQAPHYRVLLDSCYAGTAGAAGAVPIGRNAPVGTLIA